MNDSTIALIERLKQLSSPEAEILSDGYRLDEFVKSGFEAATELTTLLQRCEKAEAALERLGSTEAFTISFWPKDNNEGKELRARIDFARAARNAMGEPNDKT